MKIQLGSIELTKRQVYALGWIEPFWNGWTRDRVRTLNLRCTPRFAYEFVRGDGIYRLLEITDQYAAAREKAGLEPIDPEVFDDKDA